MGETTGRWPSHELDVADEAEVDGGALLVRAVELLAEVDVVAGHAQRVGAAGAQGVADLAVDLAVEGILDDPDGGGVGHAHAAAELGL